MNRPVFALALLAGIAASQVAFPQVSDFPSIVIVVGFSPGGADDGGPASGGAAARLQPQPGYDQTARLYARYLGGFLPGKPLVSVRHLPGASGARAAQYLAREAPGNGSVLGVMSSQALLAALGAGPGAKYQITDFAFIGARAADEYLCAADRDAMKEGGESWEGLVFGATAPGRRPHVHAGLAMAIRKENQRIVVGYRHANELMLALRRGEISALCGLSFETLRAGIGPWIASGRLTPILRFAPPFMERLRSVPRASDLAGQGELAEKAELFSHEGTIAWTLAAPSAIRLERLAALRAGFAEMQRDHAYLREAQRRNLSVEPFDLERINDSIDALSRAAAGLRARGISPVSGP